MYPRMGKPFIISVTIFVPIPAVPIFLPPNLRYNNFFSMRQYQYICG